MLGQAFNYIKQSLKKNFTLQDWIERIQAIFMGVVLTIVLGWGEYAVASALLFVALIDPKWFEDK
jgi:hypothetical protein